MTTLKVWDDTGEKDKDVSPDSGSQTPELRIHRVGQLGVFYRVYIQNGDNTGWGGKRRFDPNFPKAITG